MSEENQEKAITEITNELRKKKSIYGETLSLSEQVELDEIAFYLYAVKISFNQLFVIKGNQESLIKIDLSKDAPQRLLDIREGKKRAYLFLKSLEIERAKKFSIEDFKK